MESQGRRPTPEHFSRRKMSRSHPSEPSNWQVKLSEVELKLDVDQQKVRWLPEVLKQTDFWIFGGKKQDGSKWVKQKKKQLTQVGDGQREKCLEDP